MNALRSDEEKTTVSKFKGRRGVFNHFERGARLFLSTGVEKRECVRVWGEGSEVALRDFEPLIPGCAAASRDELAGVNRHSTR